MKKMNMVFVVYASLIGVAACGDTITNVSTGGPGSGNSDGGQADTTIGAGADTGTGTDPMQSKDGSIPSPDPIDSSVPTTCSAGEVQCAGGVAQECFASVWKNTAAACVAACAQPAGTWIVDRSVPAAVNVRRNKDGIVFTRTLSAPMSLDDAKYYCSQLGDQSNPSSRWGIPFVELSMMSPDPVVVGCNPVIDQAAFPGIPVNTEVWAWNGNTGPSGAYSFSLTTNSMTQVSDSILRPVICRKLLP